jgi:hypothetical protein
LKLENGILCPVNKSSQNQQIQGPVGIVTPKNANNRLPPISTPIVNRIASDE